MQIYNIFDLRKICIKILCNTYILHILCLISVTDLRMSASLEGVKATLATILR